MGAGRVSHAQSPAPPPRSRATEHHLGRTASGGLAGYSMVVELLYGRRHAARSPGSAQGHASKYAGQSWPWLALQRASGRRRPDGLRPRLQDGTRRHRVETEGLALSLGALAGLAQDEDLGAAAVKREAEEEWCGRRWR